MSTTVEEMQQRSNAMTAAELAGGTESRATVGDVTVADPRMVCRDVDVWYGAKQAIKRVSLDIGKNEVVAMIGPRAAASRPFCGVSTA